MMISEWSRDEVREIVADYFDMLRLDLTGEKFNKAALLRSLQPRLRNRTRGSVEYKRENISAAMIDLGLPYVSGYLPKWNYQQEIVPAICEHLSRHAEHRRVIEQDVVRPVTVPEIDDILSCLDDPPDSSTDVSKLLSSVFDSLDAKRGSSQRPFTDYLAREAHNIALGLAGEKFVIKFEKTRLQKARRESLAERIEHVSIEQGDGAGFDIRSFETNGEDRFIEVKTTGYGKETPFFVTSNELRFSQRRRAQYELYRVFLLRMKKRPGLFTLHGAIDESCSDLRPTQYVVRV